MIGFIFLESRRTGTHIYGTGGTEIFSRLEDAAFLSVIQRYFLHIVKGELPEIYLTVLGVSKLNTVIYHSRMVCSHRADVDGLYATDTSIILYLNTGKIS